MSEYVIESSSLSKRFGRKTALRHLDLQVPRGGVHALVGRNGAGKSTLFRILLGFLHSSAGSSRVLGVDSAVLAPETRGRIGFVNEEHALPGWMKVASLAAMQRDHYPSWNEHCFEEVSEQFQVLGEQKVSELSRGERAGLNLALALAQSPELLILDEPTLGLDVVAKQAFVESLLFSGERSDGTIVYCSHQMDEVERVADNLMILEHGELVSVSPPDEFSSRISGWMVDAWPSSIGLEVVPGLLQSRDLDGRRQLIVIDQDERFSEVLEGLGAGGVQRVPVGFDRAVNAYLTRRQLTKGT